MMLVTKVQYKSGMKLQDENGNLYLVVSSLDLKWIDKKRKGYLTNLVVYGKVSKTK